MEWSVHNHFNCTLNFMFLLSSPSFILSEHPVRFPPVSEGVPPTPLPSAPDMIAGLWSSPAVGFPSPCALLWHSFRDDSVPCLFESGPSHNRANAASTWHGHAGTLYWHEKDDRNFKTKQGGPPPCPDVQVKQASSTNVSDFYMQRPRAAFLMRTKHSGQNRFTTPNGGAQSRYMGVISSLFIFLHSRTDFTLPSRPGSIQLHIQAIPGGSPILDCCDIILPILSDITFLGPQGHRSSGREAASARGSFGSLSPPCASGNMLQHVSRASWCQGD